MAKKRTWDEWVVYLRLIEVEIREKSVDLIVGLMELESDPSIWRITIGGLRPQIFDVILNDAKRLGLTISPKRYRRGQAAVLEFGEKLVRRYGLDASQRALGIDGKARVEYFKSVEQWMRKYGRPPTDQAALNLLRRVLPPEQVAPTKTSSIVQKLRKRIRDLEADNADLAERLAESSGIISEVKSFHESKKIKFDWTAARRRVRARRRKP